MTSPEPALVREKKARLHALVAKDSDHLDCATGDTLTWLIEQSLRWPDRVDPNYTTNDRFLRYSMASTLLASEARAKAAEDALRAIAEGNLGDMPWQANYERIREHARAVLVAGKEGSSAIIEREEQG